jgi:hypothetical protein
MRKLLLPSSGEKTAPWLKIEAIVGSKMSVHLYQTVWCHSPGDNIQNWMRHFTKSDQIQIYINGVSTDKIAKYERNVLIM